MRKTIGILGGGNMGAAIIGKMLNKHNVLVCEKEPKRIDFLKRNFHVSVRDLNEVVSQSDIIILAIKPQDMEGILKEIKSAMTKDKLVISIAAGITSLYIEKRLGTKTRVIRTMPNMPALIGEGITAVSKGRYATESDVKTASEILNSIGETVVVKENLIDAVTATSGSGPAYVFLFVECFIKAAESLGLDKNLSKRLVLKTLLGSSHLLAKSKDDAATLRAKVTSKGGTTQAAMEVFQKRKIEQIFNEALKAAKKRSGELARR